MLYFTLQEIVLLRSNLNNSLVILEAHFYMNTVVCFICF